MFTTSLMMEPAHALVWYTVRAESEFAPPEIAFFRSMGCIAISQHGRRQAQVIGQHWL